MMRAFHFLTKVCGKQHVFPIVKGIAKLIKLIIRDSQRKVLDKPHGDLAPIENVRKFAFIHACGLSLKIWGATSATVRSPNTAFRVPLMHPRG
jgi:hypothetical protein